MGVPSACNARGKQSPESSKTRSLETGRRVPLRRGGTRDGDNGLVGGHFICIQSRDRSPFHCLKALRVIRNLRIFHDKGT